jgi:hypothetical protein
MEKKFTEKHIMPQKSSHKIRKAKIENSFDVPKDYKFNKEKHMKSIKLPKHSNLNPKLLQKIADSKDNTATFNTEKNLAIDLIVHMVLDLATMADKIMDCVKSIWNPFTIISSIMPVYASGRVLYELYRYKRNELWEQIKDIDGDEAKTLWAFLFDSIKVAFK